MPALNKDIHDFMGKEHLLSPNKLVKLYIRTHL